ncbi:MAG: ATP-binding cassette domain-containing protein [Spirochaetales bacterium]|nr:ATP-binding cassette domain-containing protein [Spirochaetales bacterium]
MLLKAEHLDKYYNEVHALADFSFEIEAGEIVALVGDNGAGKSTFAKMLAGVVQPNSGTIYWNDEPVEINSIRKSRELGIETVYQEQAIADQLTLTRNIFLGREIRKDSFPRFLDNKSMDEQAKKVVDELGLHVQPNQQVKFFSGGERQGVAVARAFLFKAQLVILDEPTRGISMEGVSRIINFIKSLKEQNIAVIIISHIFPHIFSTTDRFVIMSRGSTIAKKQREETSPEELTEIVVQKHQ